MTAGLLTMLPFGKFLTKPWLPLKGLRSEALPRWAGLSYWSSCPYGFHRAPSLEDNLCPLFFAFSSFTPEAKPHLSLLDLNPEVPSWRAAPAPQHSSVPHRVFPGHGEADLPYTPSAERGCLRMEGEEGAGHPVPISKLSRLSSSSLCISEIHRDL